MRERPWQAPPRKRSVNRNEPTSPFNPTPTLVAAMPVYPSASEDRDETEDILRESMDIVEEGEGIDKNTVVVSGTLSTRQMW